jgi:hypothetical protein
LFIWKIEKNPQYRKKKLDIQVSYWKIEANSMWPVGREEWVFHILEQAVVNLFFGKGDVAS